MTGSEYAELVARYVAARFGSRGIKVFREVSLGKSVIGKDRRVDILCVPDAHGAAFVIECKFQDSKGTVDEKIPYALSDIRACPVKGCVVYGGDGFSEGVQHMLAADKDAASCLPEAGQSEQTVATRELDHLLAAHFGWWDVLVEGKSPV